MKTTVATAALLLSSTTTLVFSSPVADGNENNNPAPVCGTCNPILGQNHCDPTTSCINTGSHFHCACRAGYKASQDNHDFNKQFHLKMPNYEFLVFTPINTVCNTLCDHPFDGVGTLCTEVVEQTGPGCAP